MSKTQALAPQRDVSSRLAPDVAQRAIGAQILYQLPNGQQRPAILVAAADEGRSANIRVFCNSATDSQYFAGHWGVEMVEGAPYAEAGANGAWSFREDDLLRTMWPA